MPNMYAYVEDSNTWIDPFGLECKRPGGYKTGDTDAHKNLSPQVNRATGHKNILDDDLIQSHHFIAQEWVKRNLPNASSVNKNSPAILIPSKSGMSHANITRSQGIRRRAGEFDTNTLR